MAETWARLLTPNDLGSFVADLRIERNLTQQELADELGVRRQYVIEIEAGKHTLHQDRLFALLRLLGARLTIAADIERSEPVSARRLRGASPRAGGERAGAGTND